MQKSPPENDSKIQVYRQNLVVFEVFGGQGGEWQKGQFNLSITFAGGDRLRTE